MKFADDVVLCTKEKYVLELELEQWREGRLREERNESVKSKDRVHVSEWNVISLGSVLGMQSAQLPQVTEFKYLGSTLRSDDDMSTEVNKDTMWTEQLEKDVRRPML